MNKAGAMKQGMRVLVVGNGAREHTIAWKLSQSPSKPVLYAAPGNPGMEGLCQRIAISQSDVAGLVEFAQREHIDLIVVGPEAPLAAGLVDRAAEIGIRAFGPSAGAAALETSKAFAKGLMKQVGVRTAKYEVFTDAAEARAYVKAQGAPIVIKADGLAAGKGVVVAQKLSEALEAVDEALVQQRFGESGQSILVEEYLEGPEASLMFFVDASGVQAMVPARDYKRIGDGNTGPNTGGMGAIAPVLQDMPGIAEQVEADIVRPVLDALASLGSVYRGVLYVGLMMTTDGPAVIEFNVRFGDPETQVVLPLLKTDLLEVLWAVAGDSLADVQLEWHQQFAVGVVSACSGYPDAPKTGSPIEIQKGDWIVLHAGTAWDGPTLVTAGGRVLTTVGVGQTAEEARAIAYLGAGQVYFEGRQLRSDIGL